MIEPFILVKDLASKLLIQVLQTFEPGTSQYLVPIMGAARLTVVEQTSSAQFLLGKPLYPRRGLCLRPSSRLGDIVTVLQSWSTSLVHRWNQEAETTPK